MAEDAIDKAIELGDLPARTCVTVSLKIEDEKPGQINELLRENSEFSELICEDLPFQKSEIVHSVRNEMALPDRFDDSRAPTEKELKATSVIRIEIEEASAKIRSGDPIDDRKDYDSPFWAGVLPIETSFGKPIADSKLDETVELPDYLQ